MEIDCDIYSSDEEEEMDMRSGSFRNRKGCTLCFTRGGGVVTADVSQGGFSGEYFTKWDAILVVVVYVWSVFNLPKILHSHVYI